MNWTKNAKAAKTAQEDCSKESLRTSRSSRSISRRAALEILGAAPAAAAMMWTTAEAEQAHAQADHARAQATTAGARFKPKFFTAHEYATVGVLVDLVIPRDDRSGSATEAGVPEFMDFMMIDQPRRQVAMRGGLALVDRLAVSRFGKNVVGASDAQRRRLLDEIAYTPPQDHETLQPARPEPVERRARSGQASEERHEMSQAIAFFNSFRDLTATGFFTSKMGMADLQYQGNVFVSEWTGCPDAAMKKLGVS
jgi:gluconate 2-dehydrogenase gamma chain